MSYRLHGGLRSLGDRLKNLLLVWPAGHASAPRLRGKMRRAVVVPSPDPFFTEAVFILRDEALREPGLTREELLRQASRAAESYTETALPATGRVSLRPGAAFLLGAALTLLLLWATGLL